MKGLTLRKSSAAVQDFGETVEVTARRLIGSDVPDDLQALLEFQEPAMIEGDCGWMEEQVMESRNDRLEEHVHAAIPSVYHVVPIYLKLPECLEPTIQARLGLDENCTFTPVDMEF